MVAKTFVELSALNIRMLGVFQVLPHFLEHEKTVVFGHYTSNLAGCPIIQNLVEKKEYFYYLQ